MMTRPRGRLWLRRLPRWWRASSYVRCGAPLGFGERARKSISRLSRRDTALVPARRSARVDRRGLFLVFAIVQFGAAWWIYIDGTAYGMSVLNDDTTKTTAGYSWLPGVFGTVAFIACVVRGLIDHDLLHPCRPSARAPASCVCLVVLLFSSSSFLLLFLVQDQCYALAGAQLVRRSTGAGSRSVRRLGLAGLCSYVPEGACPLSRALLSSSGSCSLRSAFLLISMLVALASISVSLYIMVNRFLDVDSVPSKWPGIAIFLQNLLIFASYGPPLAICSILEAQLVLLRSRVFVGSCLASPLAAQHLRDALRDHPGAVRFLEPPVAPGWSASARSHPLRLRSWLVGAGSQE